MVFRLYSLQDIWSTNKCFCDITLYNKNQVFISLETNIYILKQIYERQTWNISLLTQRCYVALWLLATDILTLSIIIHVIYLTNMATAHYLEYQAEIYTCISSTGIYTWMSKQSDKESKCSSVQ